MKYKMTVIIDGVKEERFIDFIEVGEQGSIKTPILYDGEIIMRDAYDSIFIIKSVNI